MKKVFTVSMDKEQKKLKNFMTVEINVDMSAATREELEEYAFKAYIVKLQSQIRPNWDAFENECIDKKFTKSLKFGDALFESNKGHITTAKAMDKVKEELNKLPPKERFARMRDEGMISKEMYEQMMEMLG
mgnify:FL=1